MYLAGQKFRKCNEIEFFDRIEYFRNIDKLYSWKVDRDTIKHEDNVFTFELKRDYEQWFKDLASSQNIDVTLIVVSEAPIFIPDVLDSKNFTFIIT